MSSRPARRAVPPHRLVMGAAVVLGLVVTACVAAPDPEPTPVATTAPSPAALAAVTAPAAELALVGVEEADAVALAASRALYERGPVVVLASAAEHADQLVGASAAVALGVPLLLTGGPADGEVAAELERLGATAVLVVGSAATPAWLDAGLGVVTVTADGRAADALAGATGLRLGDAQAVEEGQELVAVAALGRPTTTVLSSAAAVAPAAETPEPADTPAPAASASEARLPRVSPPEPAATTTVLTDGSRAHLAAVATARAAGMPVVLAPGGDPRASAATVDALAGVGPVLALGPAFGSPEVLAARLAAVSTGVQAPGGGQLVFPAAPGAPGKKYVALYGTPGTAALGLLGEQDVPATIARAQQLAAEYQALTADTVVPMLEVIATIASAGPEDGSYSRMRPIEELRPLVEAAGDAGIAVVLDLQPGRTDFVTQAQQYAELLALPHVSLALDPEWRLAPDQVHLRQIGSVGIDEVNAVVAWLADFTRERALPQKMLVLHQFSLRMISERERLDTSRDELALLIHVDGQGSQPAKAGTWAALRAGAPAGVRWGWKNFIDEDVPMLDPVQTYQVQPVPDLVTYQ
ncbi:cell wall-binding repeat-containing protein [Cellulomonas chengniuliangii]|uniref:Lipoprotein n=1 Tax=Cellulomonas chengniuliangii TaxID=2968084 RepID=A0ABY5L4B4_9CELL|nr:cell wall-binding repeat-containing protein [Cellulomonas chengniuliangii]MCC2307998.1 hypothetical protein [Cellulomonas chengniuliangii]UUI76402.1 hypothetical protein NP064_05770 [Cellulomonas chengniuliangii]